MENLDLRNIDPNRLSKKEIINIQKYLINKNYDLGKTGADGIFGRKTKIALDDYNANYVPSKSRLGKLWEKVANPIINRSSEQPFIERVTQVANTPFSYITGNPGVYALSAAVHHLWNDKIVDNITEEGSTMNKLLSWSGKVRDNTSITPKEQKIYNSLGQYIIKNGYDGLSTKVYNNWWRDVGSKLNKEIGLGIDPEDTWKYSQNNRGWMQKLFAPIERIANTNGQMSIEKDENGNYYFTDLYDHNKSTFISDDYVNSKGNNNSYLNLVKIMQDKFHPSDEDSDYEKKATRIRFYMND